MSSIPIQQVTNGESAARVARGREIIRAEQQVLGKVAECLDEDFDSSVELLLGCPGKVITCGMGKAGIVGQKLAASLSSTGTPAQFMHPGEAVHGDLGCIRAEDVVVVLSYSGETEEVTRLLPVLTESTRGIVAITASEASTLGKAADAVLKIGRHPEACRLNLAPSSSTTAMMAIGDALALVVSEQRGFTHNDFGTFHPGGSLGRKLMRVDEIMRPIEQCRIAEEHLTVREVLVHVSRPGRRTGAIILTDSSGCLSGVFTDSDLARRLEQESPDFLGSAIAHVMTRSVRVVETGCLLSEVVDELVAAKISELPVIDAQRQPIGIVDVTDVVQVMNGTSRSDPRPNSQTTASDAASHQVNSLDDSNDVPRIIPINRRS